MNILKNSGRYFICTFGEIVDDVTEGTLQWYERHCPIGQRYSLGYGRCIIGNCDDSDFSDSDESSESNEIQTTHKSTIRTTPKYHNMTTSHPTAHTTPKTHRTTSRKPIRTTTRNTIATSTMTSVTTAKTSLTTMRSSTTSRRTTPKITSGTTPKTTRRTTKSTRRTTTRPAKFSKFSFLDKLYFNQNSVEIIHIFYIFADFTAQDCKEKATPNGPFLFPHHICYRYYECILMPSGRWMVKRRWCPSNGKFMFQRQKCRAGNCVLYP